MNLSRLLRIYPVLDHVPQPLLGRIRAEAVRREWVASQRLFDRLTPCGSHAFLLEGTVRISRTSADGREVLLYRVRPGDNCTVTALSLLGEGAYPADGTAESNVTLCTIPRSLFLELVLRSEAFRAFVFASLSDRLAHVMALVDDMAFRRVDERLALRLAEAGPAIDTTHRMLAEELATSREVVSRILESFQHTGLIRLRRRHIDILDRSALQKVGGVAHG